MDRRRKFRYRVDVRLDPVDVVVHPARELDELRERVAKLESDLGHMSMYAPLALALTDQLREAKEILDELGEDTSFIRLRGN